MLPREAAMAIDLAAVAAGTGGFVVHGEDAYDQSGGSVAAAGDVNGDGLADLLVGAPFAAGAGNAEGGTYVVFGRAGRFDVPVDLAAVAAGEGGFVIHGEDAYDYAGVSVAAVGDLNGDGLADVLVGAPWGDGAGDAEPYAGAAYVVFGRAGGAAVDLAAVAAGTGGFAVRGEDAGDGAGRSVAATGDVDGDGLADLLVGADGAEGAAPGGRARLAGGAALGSSKRVDQNRIVNAGT
jgi:FG-GAP repeat protein